MAGTTTVAPLEMAAPVGLTFAGGAWAAGPGTEVAGPVDPAWGGAAADGGTLYGAALGDGRTAGSASDAGAGGGMFDASGPTVDRKLPTPGKAAEP
jgi:hypothetical protein